MAPSEYADYLGQSPNKRRDFLDENAGFDTYLYNNGIPPDQIVLIRDNIYGNSPYDNNLNCEIPDNVHQRLSDRNPRPMIGSDGGRLYRPNDARQYQVTPTVPQVQTYASSDSWVGARSPQIPAYLRPSSLPSHMRPDPENARRYHEKQEEAEELRRKIAGIKMYIYNKKRHGRFHQSHFQAQEDEIEDLKKQIDKLEKEEQQLRRRSNREVKLKGGHVDYGHRKAAGETSYENYLKNGREAKKESRKRHTQFRNGYEALR